MLLWIIFFIYHKGWDNVVYLDLMPDIQVTFFACITVLTGYFKKKFWWLKFFLQFFSELPLFKKRLFLSYRVRIRSLAGLQESP
jgi:hypothetical protein